MNADGKEDDALVGKLLSLYGINADGLDKSQVMAALAEIDKAGDIMRDAERKFKEKYGVDVGFPVAIGEPTVPKKKHKRRKARNKQK